MEQITFLCCRCDENPQTWTKVLNVSLIQREYHPLDLAASGSVNTKSLDKRGFYEILA